MTKSDCTSYIKALTTASNGTNEIKIWCHTDPQARVTHYFLDNGAECTNLVYWQDNKLWYKGGGWLERLLGKSFKGTSEDINKLTKWIIGSAIIIAALCIIAPIAYNHIKNIKPKTK